MLILSRKVGEKVILEMNGVLIMVKVTEVRSGRVRLSFDAPIEVSIRREELDERGTKDDRKEG